MSANTNETIDNHVGYMLRHAVGVLKATGWTRAEVMRAFKNELVLDFVFGPEDGEEDDESVKQEAEVEEEEEGVGKGKQKEEKDDDEKDEDITAHTPGMAEDGLAPGYSMADDDTNEGSVSYDTAFVSGDADDEDSLSTVIYTIPGDPNSVINKILDKPARKPY